MVEFELRSAAGRPLFRFPTQERAKAYRDEMRDRRGVQGMRIFEVTRTEREVTQ